MSPRSHAYHPLNVTSLAPLLRRGATCVLLDTASPLLPHRSSYLFLDPIDELCAWTCGEIPHLLKDLDQRARDFWLCGYLAYETGYALEEKFAPIRQTERARATPLAWFGMFDRPFVFDHARGVWDRNPVRRYPEQRVWTNGQGQAHTLAHTISCGHYSRAIASIRRLIARGDTYQVNFTYDTRFDSRLRPFALYLHLRQSQPAPYCAFLKNRYEHVLSFSPELFFEKRACRIRVKPMKGTAGRGRFAAEDAAMAKALSLDPKNRAENVMIVDLLRNDLGRICETGTVRTERLFEVETHPTLHQMTSTVAGRLRRGVTVSDIVGNIFPSGSVTGAPKIRTMEIIHALERGERGVYTGMLGFVSPKHRAEFSVPIRTLHRAHADTSWRYRVGSGVVWDSNARKEWDECATKCAFLLSSRRDFEILETLLFCRGKASYWRDHGARMCASAKFFGYPLPQEALRRALVEIRNKLGSTRQYRIRMLLDHRGTLRWESTPLEGWETPRFAVPDHRSAVTNPQSASQKIVLFSSKPVDERDPMLFHKTTHRPWYEEAMKKIREGRCAEIVFMNSRRQITEGSVTNIFIERDGVLFTPPVECGLLAGVLRQRLLKSGRCREKILYRKDVREADAVYCGNSVRGLFRVHPS